MPRGEYVRDRMQPGHGKPTEIQRRTWEVVQETGSQLEACRILGKSQGAIQSALFGYQHAMGLTGKLPGARVYRTGVRRGEGTIGQLRERVAVLERERDAAVATLEAERTEHRDELLGLMKRIAALEEQARPWAAIHAKLDQLLKRPAGPIVPTHRRLSDGGVGGKRERRGQVPAA